MDLSSFWTNRFNFLCFRSLLSFLSSETTAGDSTQIDAHQGSVCSLLNVHGPMTIPYTSGTNMWVFHAFDVITSFLGKRMESERHIGGTSRIRFSIGDCSWIHLEWSCWWNPHPQETLSKQQIFLSPSSRFYLKGLWEYQGHIAGQDKKGCVGSSVLSLGEDGMVWLSCSHGLYEFIGK